MSFSHSDLAYEFVVGTKKGKGSSMFIEGNAIYSYGHHFPIALRLNNGCYLFNKDRYSPSTSKHQHYVYSEISSQHGDHNIYFCNTAEIQGAICSPELPIVITEKVKPTDVEECVELMKDIYKARGLKHFPKAKILTLVRNWEILKCL